MIHIADSVTYHVANMRFVVPSDKVAEKNPDRFGTVYGEFSNADGEAMSITSKVITNDLATNPLTAIDVKRGILTLPEGRRGRTASKGLSQDDLSARLAALRKG